MDGVRGKEEEGEGDCDEGDEGEEGDEGRRHCWDSWAVLRLWKSFGKTGRELILFYYLRCSDVGDYVVK